MLDEHLVSFKEYATNFFLLIGSLGGEFWSAIAGAVVGGLIAYLVQLKALREARSDRAEERKLADKALAFSLFLKVLSIFSNFAHIKAHVDERLAIGAADKIEEVGPVLLAVANLPTPVEFSPNELGMLLALKDDDVFNEVISLDKIHNSIIPAWTLYAQLRATVEEMAKVDKFDAVKGKSGFSVQRGSPLDIKRYELEQFARQLVQRSATDANDADRALKSLTALLNNKLGLAIGITAK